jgi:Rrp15p
MVGHVGKKRKVEAGMKGRIEKPKRKFKKQKNYDSDGSSEEEQEEGFTPVNLLDDEKEDDPAHDDEPELSEDSDNSENASGDDSEASLPDTTNSKKRKRNDPLAFATSMSKILGSKLSTSKRPDPVLSRSKEASEAAKELTESKIEAKARRSIREGKREALEKGRVKDVLLGSTAGGAILPSITADGEEIIGPSVGATMEQERRLRKTAQRGVVKLFNAVRAAQVKGEEAQLLARQKNMVGVVKRGETEREMTKKGFLDLIGGGPGGGGVALKASAGAIEEA